MELSNLENGLADPEFAVPWARDRSGYNGGIEKNREAMNLMKFAAIGCLGLLVIVGVVVMIGVGGYNRLVALEEGVDAAWGQVENVYQRRADLIPNLVATVKGSAEFEQETLTAVIEARAKVGQVNFEQAPDAAQLQQFQQAQDGLSSALSRLLVVVERYPDIKSTQAFRDLQVQLEGTENRISVERMRFNEKAQAYNTARLRFPAVIIARILGFGEKAYFQAAPGADQAPSVDFQFGDTPAPPAEAPQ